MFILFFKEVYALPENNKKKKDSKPKKAENENEKKVNPNENESEDLSDLRDLVQTEIDKIMVDSDGNKKDWKKLVNDARNPGRSSEIPEDELCLCCGEKQRAEGHDYCDDCLVKLKKMPIPIWKFIIPVLLIGVVILSSWKIAVTWSLFKTADTANDYAKDKKLLSALDAYDNYNVELAINGKDPGYRMLNKQIELYEELGVGYYSDLSDFIDTRYAGKDLDSFFCKKAKEADDLIDVYSNAYDVCYGVYSSAKSFDDYITQLDEAVKDDPVDKSLLNYYKYYAALLYGESTDVQLKYLNAMQKASTQYASVYLPCYAELYIDNKDYDKALSYCDKMLELNKENIYAFTYRAFSYRMQGNYSLAIKACNDGLKASSDNTLICYQMAVLQLLDGQESSALEYAKISYENADTEYAYLESSSLYALCLYITGDTDSYSTLKEEVESYSYTFADEVQSYIDGKVTIKNIFTENGGVFSWT